MEPFAISKVHGEPNDHVRPLYPPSWVTPLPPLKHHPYFPRFSTPVGHRAVFAWRSLPGDTCDHRDHFDDGLSLSSVNFTLDYKSDRAHTGGPDDTKSAEETPQSNREETK